MIDQNGKELLERCSRYQPENVVIKQDFIFSCDFRFGCECFLDTESPKLSLVVHDLLSCYDYSWPCHVDHFEKDTIVVSLDDVRVKVIVKKDPTDPTVIFEVY